MLRLNLLLVLVIAGASGEEALRTAIRDAQKLTMAGDVPSALQSLESALRAHAKTSDPDTLALALNEVGSLHLDLGNPQQSIRLLERSVHLFEQQYGRGCGQALVPLSNLARAWAAQRNFSKAQKALEQVLETRRAISGELDPALGNTWANLANVFLARGRLAEADSCARQSIRLLELDPGEWPLALASAYNVLGLVRAERAAVREALVEVRKAVAIVEIRLAPGHPEIAFYLLNLASLHVRLREWREAEAVISRVLALVESRPGDLNPLRAEAFLLAAKAYRATGRKTEAKQASRQARSILAADGGGAAQSLVSVDDLRRRR